MTKTQKSKPTLEEIDTEVIEILTECGECNLFGQTPDCIIKLSSYPKTCYLKKKLSRIQKQCPHPPDRHTRTPTIDKNHVIRRCDLCGLTTFYVNGEPVKNWEEAFPNFCR